MPAWLLAPATRWLAAGAVLLVLFGAWRVEAARREAADLRAVAAEEAVKGRDTAIAALERLAVAVAERDARFQPIRRAVDAAPVTHACVAAPAVRAALDGLRARDAGAAGVPAVDAGVPAGAAGARRPR
ncbi:hypothetical protein GXW78_25625 [Roseomonas terrae]|uniref:Uncharacterized protein n=1 Tax=Neoroseomonas terrae TaxID=424799 RepID=A0ABS5EPY5_9PROT|nr:hypothetical protein [Neoroseomonas terrae]MBR0653062.1 hypothetical protein [Neoroseomonas terrae]